MCIRKTWSVSSTRSRACGKPAVVAEKHGAREQVHAVLVLDPADCSRGYREPGERQAGNAPTHSRILGLAGFALTSNIRHEQTEAR